MYKRFLKVALFVYCFFVLSVQAYASINMPSFFGEDAGACIIAGLGFVIGILMCEYGGKILFWILRKT